jgi:ATP-dependent helicase/DNAse subunit B
MILAGKHAIDSIKKNCEMIFSGEFPAMPARIEKNAYLDCKKCKFSSVCNGEMEAPKYRFLPSVPEKLNTEGKAMKNKEAFFETLREEGNV